MSITTAPAVGLSEVVEFLDNEARLLDSHEYEEWEALWADDGIYWVPSGADDIDPQKHVSYIYDNRRRIHTRLTQLKTGFRFAQVPASRLTRIIGGVRILNAARAHANEIEVESKFVLAEYRTDVTTVWAGSLKHTLRRTPEGLRLVLKKVMLNNNGGNLLAFGFLL